VDYGILLVRTDPDNVPHHTHRDIFPHHTHRDPTEIGSPSVSSTAFVADADFVSKSNLIRYLIMYMSRQAQRGESGDGGASEGEG